MEDKIKKEISRNNKKYQKEEMKVTKKLLQARLMLDQRESGVMEARPDRSFVMKDS